MTGDRPVAWAAHPEYALCVWRGRLLGLPWTDPLGRLYRDTARPGL
jgi:hypothetical protein